MMILEHRHARTSPAIAWGVVVGALNVAFPVALWWVDAATVHAVTIALIASVYVGFAVADGRAKVIAVESAVAAAFAVTAASAASGWVWLLVIGYFAHGGKDVWQHRTQFVAGTRWWPPFCATVDFVVAAALSALILGGVDFH